MKNKIVLILSSILSAFIFALSFFFNNTNKVKANTNFQSESTLVCYGKEFDLPITCFICYYQAGSCNSRVRNTMYRGNQTYHYKFTINSADDINEFIRNFDGDTLYIDFDSTLMYEINDCLSETFMLFSYDNNLFKENQILEGTCISDLMSIDGVVGIVSPDCEYLTTEYIYTIDKLIPVINGDSAYYITDVDNPVDVSTIQGCLRATDNADGDITNQIVIELDEYSNSNKTIGEYNIVFAVEDSSKNKATFTVIVSVQDITPPMISGESDIISYTSKPFDSANYIEELEISDNVNNLNYFEDKITIIEDNYSANKYKLGTYMVVYQTTDEAGNDGYLNINVTVVDDVKPIISGNNSYNKSVTASLKVSQIMTGLKANDDVDGDLYKKITIKEDNYSNKSQTVGTYTIVFTVKDSSNNISNDFVVNVKVTDDILPIFYISNTLINVTEYNAMTHQDIVDFLMDTNAIKSNVESVSFIYDEYSENSNKSGEYKVSLKANYKEGKSEVIDVIINVNGLSETNESIKKDPVETESFFDKLFSFLMNILTKISEFFKNTINFLAKVFSNN